MRPREVRAEREITPERAEPLHLRGGVHPRGERADADRLREPEHVLHHRPIALRVGDRLGSGTKVGLTPKLKKFKERSIEVQKEPISTRMLAIDGNDLMRELKLKPGPAIGRIQDALLEEVLDDPERNTKDYLLERARALHKEA